MANYTMYVSCKFVSAWCIDNIDLIASGHVFFQNKSQLIAECWNHVTTSLTALPTRFFLINGWRNFILVQHIIIKRRNEWWLLKPVKHKMFVLHISESNSTFTFRSPANQFNGIMTMASWFELGYIYQLKLFRYQLADQRTFKRLVLEVAIMAEFVKIANC